MKFCKFGTACEDGVAADVKEVCRDYGLSIGPNG